MGSSYTMPVGAQATILLVDDYPDALDVWSLYLRMCGFDVFTAGDGLAALELAYNHRPSLVILDLDLPKLNGVEAAKCLRANADTSAIPLIAVTGHSDDRRVNEARHAGFDLILTKPCDPDHLRHEIQRLLSAPTHAHA